MIKDFQKVKKLVKDFIRNHEKPLIVVLGPTGCGKSSLGVKLVKSLNFGNIQAEIISADSRQIYKYMNIATGKLKRSEMSGVKHHMMGIVKPNEIFTAAQFVERAKKY